MADETFDFDTFFVDDSDPGVTETVTARGKSFTITVKRGLSLGDREAAKNAAMTSHVSSNGQLVIDGFDDGKFQLELLARCLKSWSLPRPVTRPNVLALSADVADACLLVLKKYIAPSEEALAPFAPQSDAA